jgi:hypothetical protein
MADEKAPPEKIAQGVEKAAQRAEQSPAHIDEELAEMLPRAPKTSGRAKPPLSPPDR